MKKIILLFIEPILDIDPYECLDFFYDGNHE